MNAPLSLITGGSGYFGSLLIEKLRSRYGCRSFDLVEDPDRPSDVEFVQGDIRDYNAILRACQGVAVVHHNVAQQPLAKDRRLFQSVNIQGTENLLRASREAGVAKVIFTSSTSVYGIPRSNPVSEETPLTPAEPYGRTKTEAERVCRSYADKGVDVTIIRPRTILGHGRLGIFQILFEWVRTGYNIPVLGRGDNLYQFIHADDLAEACIRAGERPGATSYNIGTDRFGTMREALEALCRHAATGSRVVSLPMYPAELGMRITSSLGLSPLGAYHALAYGKPLYFEVAKAKRELEWQPLFSNEEMMVQSYNWYLTHREKVLASGGPSRHRSSVKQGVLSLVKHPLAWWR
jgi:nucleoside-diphosphate-sugar epimerase